MNKTLVFGIILMIIVAAVAVVYQEQRPANEKEEVKALVDKAVVEIETNGEATFPNFNNST